MTTLYCRFRCKVIIRGRSNGIDCMMPRWKALAVVVVGWRIRVEPGYEIAGRVWFANEAINIIWRE